MSKQISPLPWENGTGHITDATGEGIVQCFHSVSGKKDDNRAFIVKAVNSHDQLVEALMVASISAGFQYMTYETRELISAALAAVEAA